MELAARVRNLGILRSRLVQRDARGTQGGTQEFQDGTLRRWLVGRRANCFQPSHHNLSVVMSFESARKDIDLLDSLAWTLVLVDEAHRLKNPNSNMTTAFGQFKCKMRIGLTGTAIQNGYEEFWTLLDWTNPGSVGTPREWKGVSDCLTLLCLR
jgi:hypothetical protein